MNDETPRRAKLRFKTHPDKTTSAESCANTISQVTNSYCDLASLLHDVRTFVISRSRTKSGMPKVADLRKHFEGTELIQAADDEDWAEWIDVFSQPTPPPPKAMTLIFLEKKTGLSRKTLKGYFSRHKKAPKE